MPDGDPLTFDIFFTRNGGASLQPLMLGLSGTSAQIDTTRLGGGVAQFRVVATDGVHSAFADTPPLTLANKPPQPRILTPGSDGKIYAGQLVNFEGEATDPQDGVVVDTGLVWRTPGRTLGSGSRLSITDLPVGANRGHADGDQQPRPLGLHDGHRQRGRRSEPTWPDADRRPDRDRMACGVGWWTRRRRPT